MSKRGARNNSTYDTNPEWLGTATTRLFVSPDSICKNPNSALAKVNSKISALEGTTKRIPFATIIKKTGSLVAADCRRCPNTRLCLIVGLGHTSNGNTAEFFSGLLVNAGSGKDQLKPNDVKKRLKILANVDVFDKKSLSTSGYDDNLPTVLEILDIAMPNSWPGLPGPKPELISSLPVLDASLLDSSEMDSGLYFAQTKLLK
jgi:hypothetical protein